MAGVVLLVYKALFLRICLLAQTPIPNAPSWRRFQGRFHIPSQPSPSLRQRSIAVSIARLCDASPSRLGNGDSGLLTLLSESCRRQRNLQDCPELSLEYCVSCLRPYPIDHRLLQDGDPADSKLPHTSCGYLARRNGRKAKAL